MSQLLRSDIVNMPFPEFPKESMAKMQSEFLAKQEALLKDVFTKFGLDVSNLELLATKVKKVQIVGDDYEYYCLIDGTKMISIKQTPDIKLVRDSAGSVTVTAETRYQIFEPKHTSAK